MVGRKLKKRYFNKLKTSKVNSCLLNFHLVYKNFSEFYCKQNFSFSKNLLHVLSNNEIGTTNIICYWLKFYSIKSYK